MYWCPCKGCRVLMKVTNKGNTQKNSSSWGPGQSPAQLGQAIALPIPPSPASVPESIPESSAIRVLICWGVFMYLIGGIGRFSLAASLPFRAQAPPRRGAARILTMVKVCHVCINAGRLRALGCLKIHTHTYIYIIYSIRLGGGHPACMVYIFLRFILRLIY